MRDDQRKFGTAPFFFTTISTILGAILFLRFGFPWGTIGLLEFILIILAGHWLGVSLLLATSEFEK